MKEYRIKVRDKGEITIPVKIRKQADIQEGDILDAEYKNGHLILVQYKGKK